MEEFLGLLDITSADGHVLFSPLSFLSSLPPYFLVLVLSTEHSASSVLGKNCSADCISSPLVTLWFWNCPAELHRLGVNLLYSLGNELENSLPQGLE